MSDGSWKNGGKHVPRLNTKHSHTYIQYITYITLHYIALHYIYFTVQNINYITLQYSTVHYITLQYSTLHYITVQYITLHYITVQYSTLHYITVQYSTVHYITLHYITVHYIHIHKHSHTFTYMVFLSLIISVFGGYLLPNDSFPPHLLQRDIKLLPTSRALCRSGGTWIWDDLGLLEQRKLQMLQHAECPNLLRAPLSLWYSAIVWKGAAKCEWCRHHPSLISSGLDLQDFVTYSILAAVGAGSPLGSKTYGNHRPFTWQSISLASAIWAGGQSSATIHDPTTKGLNQPQPLAAPYSLYSKFVFCSKNQGIIGTKIHETCWMPHLWPTMSTTSKVWIVTTSIFRYFPGPISGHFRSCGKNTPPQKSPNHHFCRRYVYHSQPFLW